jgi:hypothetical protein
LIILIILGEEYELRTSSLVELQPLGKNNLAALKVTGANIDEF